MTWCLGGRMKEPESEYDPIPFSLKWRMHFGKTERDPLSNNDIMRLSNHRIVQTHCENTEYQALKLLMARAPSIPAYKVISIYHRPEGKVVEYQAIPGKPLSTVWEDLSQEQKRRIVQDLTKHIRAMRELSPSTQQVVGDATLGAIIDPRFGNQILNKGDKRGVGPFYSIASWHEFLRRGYPCSDFSGNEVAEVHETLRHRDGKEYTLKFAHANLTPENILIDESKKIAAIVGWESAGWYPEYWEYVKLCSQASQQSQEWLGMMLDPTICEIDQYPTELECDRALRHRFNRSDYERPRSIRPPSISESVLRRETEEIDEKNTENTSG